MDDDDIGEKVDGSADYLTSEVLTSTTTSEVHLIVDSWVPAVIAGLAGLTVGALMGRCR